MEEYNNAVASSREGDDYSNNAILRFAIEAIINTRERRYGDDPSYTEAIEFGNTTAENVMKAIFEDERCQEEEAEN